MSIPSAWASVQDWMRMVALQVNPILQGRPFLSLDADPADPPAGFTYFNTASGQVRNWAGSAWKDRNSVVEGKSGAVGVSLGVSRIIKKKTINRNVSKQHMT